MIMLIKLMVEKIRFFIRRIKGERCMLVRFLVKEKNEHRHNRKTKQNKK